MRRHLPYVAVALLATACALATETYKLEPIKLGTPVFAYIGFEWTSAKPAEAGAMPSFRTKEPLFSTLRLGDKPPMLVAADLVTQGDATRCTVYLDTNWNGSLAGEKGYAMDAAETADGGIVVATPEIRVPVRYHIEGREDIVSEYRFRLACASASPDEVGLPNALCLEYGLSAVVDLDGQAARLTVCDNDGDGKISSNDESGGDVVKLDKDFEAAPEANGGVPLRPRIEHGGKFYEITLRPDGREAAIAPYEGELATLILEGTDGRGEPSPVTRFAVYNESYTADRSDIEGPQSLLPGHYELAYIIGGGDPEKHAFVLSVPDGIDARAADTLRIACGGPLKLTVTASQGEAEDDALPVEVTLSMTTEAGHTFSESGREDAPGTVEVLDPDGETVAEGRAEYG